MQGRMRRLSRFKSAVVAIFILGIATLCYAEAPVLTIESHFETDMSEAPTITLSNATEQAITIPCCDPSFETKYLGSKVVYLTIPPHECHLIYFAQIKDGGKWRDLALPTQAGDTQPKPSRLWPSEALVFIPQVSTNAECRIGVHYLTGQMTNTVWSGSIHFHSWPQPLE
jgi:hypothetical protein